MNKACLFDCGDIQTTPEDGLTHRPLRSIKIDIGTTNADYPAASIVTNMEYEESNQDKLRNIRLLDPGHVNQFVEEYSYIE